MQERLDRFSLIGLLFFRSAFGEPKTREFTTLVTVTGVGLRGLIPINVLYELEASIKKAVSSGSEDNPVLLADYIDAFSGTGSGSWIALYLASKGASGSSQLYSQKSVQDKYGDIVPGSVKGIEAFFKEYATTIYPWPPSIRTSFGLPQRKLAQETAPSGPVFSNKGLLSALDVLFGDATLSELSATCYSVAYDLVSVTGTMFVYDDLAEIPRYGYTSSTRRNTPRLTEADRGCDIVPSYGYDFLLKDVAAASASVPGFFPALEVYPVDDDERRQLLFGGELYFGQDILPAVMQVANSTQDSSLKNLAVFSVGTGITIPNLVDNANGGNLQWVFSGDMNSIVTDTSVAVLSQQTDLLLTSNRAAGNGQYLRIQYYGQYDTEEGNLLTTWYNTTLMDQLNSVGESLGDMYQKAIGVFVDRFIKT